MYSWQNASKLENKNDQLGTQWKTVFGRGKSIERGNENFRVSPENIFLPLQKRLHNRTRGQSGSSSITAGSNEIEPYICITCKRSEGMIEWQERTINHSALPEIGVPSGWYRRKIHPLRRTYICRCYSKSEYMMSTKHPILEMHLQMLSDESWL